MVSQKECVTIWEVFQTASRKPRASLLFIWLILSVVLMFATINIFHYYDVFETRRIGFYDYVVWAITLGFLSMGLLIFFLWRPFSATYRVLFHDIFMQIHRQEALSVRYEAKPKEDRKLNKRSGLFQRHASMHHKRRMNVETNDHKKVTYYDTRLIVSSGKSAHTIFQGLYYVMPYESQAIYQIRTKGKPHFKGTKFAKVLKDSRLTVWVPHNKTVTSLMKTHLKAMKNITEDTAIKQAYLAVLHDEIHLAIDYSARPKRQKNLSCDTINELYRYFMDEIHLPMPLLEDASDPFAEFD